MTLNKKNKLLIFGFIVSLYLSYIFAYKKTVEKYNAYQSKNDLLVSNDLRPETFHQLKVRDRQIDSLLKSYNSISSESYQSELLKKINHFGAEDNLKLIAFNEPHSSKLDGIVTESYIFTLEGSFNSTLLLINKLENDSQLGYIKHLSFTKKLNYKTNKYILSMNVILQKTTN